MTLGLSAARKTVVDTRVEADQQQLKQAFNAAESGIQYYLGTGSTKFTALDNASVADVVVKNIGNGTTVNFDQFTLASTNLEYWLVGHYTNGGINYGTFYNGTSLSLCIKSPFDGSLKIDYFYLPSWTVYKVKRFGYNFTSGYVSGYTDVNPAQGSCVAGYKQLALNVPLGGGSKPLLLSVRPLKNGANIYLLGDNVSVFPVQGVELSSTGRVGDINTTVGVNRKLSVMRVYQVPGFALDAITTFGDVLSN
jgi:hypothetical protein